MKEIELTKNLVSLVDDEDYSNLSQYSWHVHVGGRNKLYASRGIRTKEGMKTLLMHRILMNAPKGSVVDHINGNGLDNRRENLRICSQSQNMFNRIMSSNNTSGLRGVHYSKRDNLWMARIKVNGVKIYLGSFKNKKIAYECYVAKAKELFGQFVPNYIDVIT